MANAEKLTVYTADSAGRRWQIADATPPKIKNTENGFDVCNLSLLRDFALSWPDIGLNFQVFIFAARGDTAWHGRLESIEPRLEEGNGFVNVTAIGYWANAYDSDYSGTLSTSATPEAMITTLFSSSKLSQIASLNLYTTGLSGREYRTGNGGTDSAKVGDVIKDLCDMGDSSSPVKRVVPAVWTDRQLVTYAVTTQSPVADYTIPRALVKSISLRRALSQVYTRVTCRYKDTGGILQTATVNNTAQQAALGVDFSGSGSITNFVRVYIMDISGLSGGTTSTVATNSANARLNKVSRVTNDSDSIVVDTEYAIFSVAENQTVPLWKIRAGKWLQIPDLLPRPSDTGSGTSAGDASLSTMFYITEAAYDSQSGVLTLTPETSGELAKVVS